MVNREYGDVLLGQSVIVARGWYSYYTQPLNPCSWTAGLHECSTQLPVRDPAAVGSESGSQDRPDGTNSESVQ